jgi:hypothetical protein
MRIFVVIGFAAMGGLLAFANNSGARPNNTLVTLQAKQSLGVDGGGNYVHPGELAMSAALDSAQQGQPNCLPGTQWISTVPRFFERCTGPGPFRVFENLFNADINGDGPDEIFSYSGNPGGTLVSNGVPSSAGVEFRLYRILAVPDFDITHLESQEVFGLNFSTVGNAIVARFPDVGTVGLDASGSSSGWTWLDCDGDQDLDLVVPLRAPLPNGSVIIWFENIGYERSAPPIAADLNHDGAVDGFDLALLLNAWGAGA